MLPFAEQFPEARIIGLPVAPIGFLSGLLTFESSEISREDPGVKISLASGNWTGHARTSLTAETGTASDVGAACVVTVGDGVAVTVGSSESSTNIK